MALKKTGLSAILEINPKPALAALKKVNAAFDQFSKKVARAGVAFEKPTRGAQKLGRSSNNAARGLRKVGTAGKRVSDRLKNTSAVFRSAGTALTSLASAARSAAFALLPVAGAMAIAVRDAARFQDAMAELTALMVGEDGAEQAVTSLGMAAREMAGRTKFSAEESVKGLTELKKAGLDLQQTERAGLPTAQLAQTHNMGIGESAKLASTLLNGMGVEAKNLSKEYSKLHITAFSTSTNVKELASALSKAGPAARVMEMDTTNLNASLGAMADMGIRGGTAGRNFAAMLNKMVKRPTKEAIGYIGDFRRQVFNADGTMRDMADVIKMFSARFARLRPDIQKTAKMAVFGQRGIRAYAALDQAVKKTGKKSFGFLRDKIAAANDEMAKASDKRMESVIGQLQLMRANIAGINEGFLGTALQRLVKPLIKLNELAMGVSNALAFLGAKNKTEKMREEFLKLSEPVRQFAMGIKDAGEFVVDIVTWVKDKTTAVFKAIRKNFGPEAFRTISKYAGVFAVLATAAVPVLLVIGGIAGMVGKVLTAIGSLIISFALVKFAGVAGMALVGAFLLKFAAIIAVVVAGILVLRTAMQRVGLSFGSLMHTVTEFGIGVLEGFRPALADIAMALEPLADALGQIAELFIPLFDLLKELRGDARDTGRSAGAAVGSVATSIAIIFGGIGVVLSEIFREVKNTIRSVSYIASQVVDGLKALIEGDFVGAFKNLGQALLRTIFLPFASVTRMLMRGAEAVGIKIPAIVKDMLTNFVIPEAELDITSKSENRKPAESAKRKEVEKRDWFDELEEAVRRGTHQLVNREINVNNNVEVCADGKRMGFFISKNQKELTERQGATQTRWQRNNVQEHGQVSPVTIGRR